MSEWQWRNLTKSIEPSFSCPNIFRVGATLSSSIFLPLYESYHHSTFTLSIDRTRGTYYLTKSRYSKLAHHIFVPLDICIKRKARKSCNKQHDVTGPVKNCRYLTGIDSSVSHTGCRPLYLLSLVLVHIRLCNKVI